MSCEILIQPGNTQFHLPNYMTVHTLYDSLSTKKVASAILSLPEMIF